LLVYVEGQNLEQQVAIPLRISYVAHSTRTMV
jgi:hypothetical protein